MKQIKVSSALVGRLLWQPAAALALLLHVLPVTAMQLSGRVVDAKDQALANVRIRIEQSGAAAYSTSVFSASDGAFSVSLESTDSAALVIDAFRIGWTETARDMSATVDGQYLELRMARTEDVAEQVPPSAWLQGDHESEAYRMTSLQCSNCHQLGAQRVRRFAAKMQALPVDERAAAWLRRAVEDLAYDGTARGPASPDAQVAHPRVSAWADAVQYMRWVTLRLGEGNELRWGLEEGSEAYKALLNPETSLFSPRDMAIIIPYLAQHFPTDIDHYRGYDDLQRLGQYGVNEGTVITEYRLPTLGWTREIAIAPGSASVWFIETDKDRLGSLDPQSGAVQWYPIPGEGQQGPHTMNADAQGRLWIALEDSFYIARFDTANRDWRLYPPPPGKTFGVTHDFAYNSNRHVQPDRNGRIWITDMGMNELWGVHVERGDIQTYRMPLPVGETHFHSLLYGAAIDSERDRVWWAQLYGMVGSFDTASNRVERVVPFDRGDGPRRLAIQDDGVLWIPLCGSAQLVKFDSIRGEELARYDIPDRGASPYGVTLDKRRNAIWAATSNSDRIYRFDIETEQWRHYPLPRRESFIRLVEVDPVTGDIWTTYSALPVGARDANVYGSEYANNMIVRLHPGD